MLFKLLDFIFEYFLTKVFDYFGKVIKFFFKKKLYNINPKILPDIYGVELLKFLFEENNLSYKDLIYVFGSESNCFAILHGHDQLTVNHIDKLSKHFHIPSYVFLPQ